MRLKDVEALASEKEIETIAKEQLLISPHDGCNIQFTSGIKNNYISLNLNFFIKKSIFSFVRNHWKTKSCSTDALWHDQ